MKPVRPTKHSGYRRKDGTPYNPKHNDRNGFTKGKSAENNRYENYASLTWGGETFLDSEIACYKACFCPHIKAQNAKNKKGRHLERNLNVKQYYEKHPPEETLLYLGDKDNNVGADVLWEVFMEYREWLVNECCDNDEGCGIELLNAALHMDEATPHIHFRQMYYATDKDGNFEISQNKALTGLGFERPDLTRETSKKNNAKQTFTAVSREKLAEIAKSHGVDVIMEPLPKEEVGRTLEEYKVREQLREEKAAMEQSFQDRENALCVETQKAKEEVENLKRERNSLTHETGELKEFLAYKHDKQAKEDAEKQRVQEEEEKRRQEQVQRDREALKEELQRQIAFAMCPPTAGGYPQREKPQKASETPRNVLKYPDTLELQTPLKNDFRGRYDDDEDSDVEIICVEDDDHNDDWDFGL